MHPLISPTSCVTPAADPEAGAGRAEEGAGGSPRRPWLRLATAAGSDVEDWEAKRHGAVPGAARAAVGLALLLAVGGAAALLARRASRPKSAAPPEVGFVGMDVPPTQKRVCVKSMAEGMASWARAVRELQYAADATNHTVTIPCVNLSTGRSYRCDHAHATEMTDLFDLSGWGLAPFDAELDSHPDVELDLSKPWTIETWTEAVSSAPSVGVVNAWAGNIHLRPDQLRSPRGNDLGTGSRTFAPGGADDWPFFNFSAAREAEARHILAANGLRPSADGRPGNYVVYHWRSEDVNINYTYCAQEMLAHLGARQGRPGERLVLVSDMPFNVSAMPSLWGSGAEKIGREPTFPAAREMLIGAGFTKIEMMATKAGYDLRNTPTAYVSAWDAIIARGGERLELCRADECAPCSRRQSKFLSLLRHHFLQHHGPHAEVGESWMTPAA